MRIGNLIEQHFHGAYGVDFSKATVNEVLALTRKLKKDGISGIFPTLVTDTVENTKRQIDVIKQAAEQQDGKGAKILGIHLEGIFLNSAKKGIHDSALFLEPTIENFKRIADDFIKIVTLAPELCEKAAKGGENLISYLTNRGVKVQAGHCVGGDLTGCTGVTHLFNAMSGISHRGSSTALSALTNDKIYTEIIADGVHVSDDALRLVFKSKPIDRILLVSDCLPCTGSKVKEFDFAGSKIFYNGRKATSAEGTLAGSTTLLPKIYERLISKGIITEKQAKQLIRNSYIYHDLPFRKL